MALSHAKRAFIGVVKTTHSLHPKKYIENVLGPLPAGARIVLEGTMDGMQMLAIGYKYNIRKVLLCFVATKGAGVTSNAQPYMQRWADIHGNVIAKEIPQHAIISEYFSVSPKIENVAYPLGTRLIRIMVFTKYTIVEEAFGLSSDRPV